MSMMLKMLLLVMFQRPMTLSMVLIAIFAVIFSVGADTNGGGYDNQNNVQQYVNQQHFDYSSCTSPVDAERQAIGQSVAPQHGNHPAYGYAGNGGNIPPNMMGMHGQDVRSHLYKRFNGVPPQSPHSSLPPHPIRQHPADAYGMPPPGYGRAEGLFSRIRSSLAAAGTALAGTLDSAYSHAAETMTSPSSGGPVSSDPPAYAYAPYAPASPASQSTSPTVISSDPQLLLYDDHAVLVRRPDVLHRKKAAFRAMGASQWQVYSDFEHVLARHSALSTADMVESETVLGAEAMQRIAALTSDVTWQGDLSSDLGGEDDLVRRVHGILCAAGRLRLSDLPALARRHTSSGYLRSGAVDIFRMLQSAQVPLFVFSSGYGDLVAWLLSLSGLSPLPSNLRIVSNFLRAGPDGLVRSMTQPVVTEAGKNMTTAQQLLNMPAPQRPLALVLVSDEADIGMVEGLGTAITPDHLLSVGFLDLTPDVATRLPAMLMRCDAVVLGDGSLSFLQTLLDDLLPGAEGSNNRNSATLLPAKLRHWLGAPTQSPPNSETPYHAGPGSGQGLHPSF